MGNRTLAVLRQLDELDIQIINIDVRFVRLISVYCHCNYSGGNSLQT